jgi:hypothetical protein
MFRFLRTVFAMVMRVVVDSVTGLVKLVFEQLTHRDLAAEEAEAAQAEANARDAAAREAVVEARETAVEARHVELMDALENLAPKPARAKEVEPVVKPKSVADRRKEIQDQSRAHDPVIRSSTWTESEPDAPAVTLRVA